MSTAPLTYDRIERGLLNALNKQTELTQDEAAAGDELAEAKLAYKKAWAMARTAYRDSMRGQKFNEGMVEDAAVLTTEDAYRRLLVAEAKHGSIRQSLTSVRERMNTLRSLMVSHRTATGDDR